VSKTATLPPVRIDAAAKRGIHALLRENETVSAFVEDAVLQSISRRKQQQEELIAKGFIAAREAQSSGDYVSSDVVLKALAQRLRKKK